MNELTLAQRAVLDLANKLRNLGCAYEIHHNEDVHINGVIRPEVAKTKRTYKVPHRFYYEVYKDLHLLKPGEIWGRSVEAPGTLVGLQACVSSTANKLWGKDNYMTSIDKQKGTVQVLRIA